MPIAIRMPPILRPQVGGARSVEVSGATLGEALEDLVYVDWHEVNLRANRHMSCRARQCVRQPLRCATTASMLCVSRATSAG